MAQDFKPGLTMLWMPAVMLVVAGIYVVAHGRSVGVVFVVVGVALGAVSLTYLRGRARR